jgi:alkylated DNA repair dioxygenase AlkB
MRLRMRKCSGRCWRDDWDRKNMSFQQFSLFQSTALPEGFEYREDFLSPAEEQALISEISGLPFTEFEFHGFKGKRRNVSFGWKYDFNEGGLKKAEGDMPSFLLTLRERATLLGISPATLQHALVTEYTAGAGIGWHRDRAVFGDVIGISLASPCLFRLRRRSEAKKWQRITLNLAPRSAYRLSGAVRWDWEHSIPPVEQLRYSITFRNFRSDAA